MRSEIISPVGTMTKRKAVTTVIDDERELQRHWHVNRGIPVAFLVSSFVYTTIQLGVVVWYASQFNSRVEVVEKAQASSIPIVEGIRMTEAAQGERLTRVEEKLLGVQSGITRIETLLQPKPR